MSLKIFLFILLHEVCATAEQIFFKKGADNFKEHSLRGAGNYFLFIKNLFAAPVIWLAFLMMAASLVIWLAVLASIDLSVAVPIDSLQYVMILISSYLFLGERMHWTRVAGTVFILLGVLLVAGS